MTFTSLRLFWLLPLPLVLFCFYFQFFHSPIVEGYWMWFALVGSEMSPTIVQFVFPDLQCHLSLPTWTNLTLTPFPSLSSCSDSALQATVMSWGYITLRLFIQIVHRIAQLFTNSIKGMFLSVFKLYPWSTYKGILAELHSVPPLIELHILAPFPFFSSAVHKHSASGYQITQWCHTWGIMYLLSLILGNVDINTGWVCYNSS